MRETMLASLAAVRGEQDVVAHGEIFEELDRLKPATKSGSGAGVRWFAAELGATELNVARAAAT
jgi:hypothetical protein